MNIYEWKPSVCRQWELCPEMHSLLIGIKMARVYSWIWQVGRTLCSGAAVQHEKMTLFEMSTVMISVPVDLIFFFCFFSFFFVAGLWSADLCWVWVYYFLWTYMSCHGYFLNPNQNHLYKVQNWNLASKLYQRNWLENLKTLPPTKVLNAFFPW